MSLYEFCVSRLTTRRALLRSASVIAGTALCADVHFASSSPQLASSASNRPEPGLDSKIMRELAAWTRQSLDTPNPVPFGAAVVRTDSAERLVRSLNTVSPENDPSAHAEVHTIRLACTKLKSSSLKGYTLYTTCEPCPMCMACALWAGLDRVVYGATIADAARFTHQIRIPAAELVKRSDFRCMVDGPVERDLCLALFTDPKMQKILQKWN